MNYIGNLFKFYIRLLKGRFRKKKFSMQRIFTTYFIRDTVSKINNNNIFLHYCYLNFCIHRLAF